MNVKNTKLWQAKRITSRHSEYHNYLKHRRSIHGAFSKTHEVTINGIHDKKFSYCKHIVRRRQCYEGP